MTDVALNVQNGPQLVCDIAMAGADLALDDGMDTAVLISLFTDARASDDDPLPYENADLRGWWGDAYAPVPGDITGSKLWLLDRAKQTQDTLNRAQQYAQDALAWMIADGVGASIEVAASFPALGQIQLSIEIDRPNGPGRDHYDYVWSFA